MEQTIVLDNYVWTNPEDTDNRITINLRCSGVHFEIRYLQSNLAASPYLSAKLEESMRIMWASEEGDNREVERSLEEIDRLRIVFDTFIIKLAGSLLQPVDYLDRFLYPLYLVIDAVAPSQKSTAIQPCLRGKQSKTFGYPLHNWQESIKCFSSQQVRLLPSTSHNPCLRPSKVLATDNTGTEVACIFKLTGSDVIHKLYLGEPWVYKQIEAAIEAKKLRPDIPVCRLYGVVIDYSHDIPQYSARIYGEEIAEWNSESDNESDSSDCGRNNYEVPQSFSCFSEGKTTGPTSDGKNHDQEIPQHSARSPVADSKSDASNYKMITPPRFARPFESYPKFDGNKCMVGILVSYIENKGTLYDLAPWSDCSEARRLRWADELEKIIKELHAVGIVWGDAKPHNLLIDLEDRLWVIDLDGSYTEGWVDKDKKESQEGDLQGVMRIKNWLLNFSKKPVSRAYQNRQV